MSELSPLAQVIKAAIEQATGHPVTVGPLEDGTWGAYVYHLGGDTIGHGKTDREALVKLAALCGVELGEE
jgi:hypothetical protein